MLTDSVKWCTNAFQGPAPARRSAQRFFRGCAGPRAGAPARMAAPARASRWDCPGPLNRRFLCYGRPAAAPPKGGAARGAPQNRGLPRQRAKMPYF